MTDIVEIGGIVNSSFKRYMFTTVDKIDETIKSKNFNGDIYRTIYRYESTNTDKCNFIAPMYFDFDIDDIENNFKKIKLDLILSYRQIKTMFKLEDNDIEIYFSGSKGFHMIISDEIFGFEPSRTLNKKLKVIALKLKAFTVNKTVDTKIYDYKRLFRVVNTVNTKTGLYKVPISIETIRSFDSYKELKEYAKEKKEVINRTYKKNKYALDIFDRIIQENKDDTRRHINTTVAKEYTKNKKMFPCVRYILQNGAKEGFRNNTTVALAASLFQINNNFDEVLDVISRWNETKNEIPLSSTEIYTTVSSAYKLIQEGKRYGCSTFMELDLCVKNCPIYKE